MTEQKHPIGSLTIRGTKYAVMFEARVRDGETPSGRFTIAGLAEGRHGGSGIYADTFEDLYRKAMAASKRKAVKIAIPFMEIAHKRTDSGASDFFRSGTIVGRHAGNGNLLLKYDDQKFVEQDTRRHSMFDDDARFFRPLQPDRQREYLALAAAERRAERERAKFVKAYCFDPEDEVEEEIERKASAEPNE